MPAAGRRIPAGHSAKVLKRVRKGAQPRKRASRRKTTTMSPSSSKRAARKRERRRADASRRWDVHEQEQAEAFKRVRVKQEAAENARDMAQGERDIAQDTLEPAW